MIIWKATSVNGLVEYEQEAESFKELFDALDGRGIISDPDFPLYDTALLILAKTEVIWHTSLTRTRR